MKCVNELDYMDCCGVLENSTKCPFNPRKRWKQMRPLTRSPVNKGNSAKQFRRNAGTTKRANVAPPPNRGGYRF